MSTQTELLALIINYTERRIHLCNMVNRMLFQKYTRLKLFRIKYLIIGTQNN